MLRSEMWLRWFACAALVAPVLLAGAGEASGPAQAGHYRFDPVDVQFRASAGAHTLSVVSGLGQTTAEAPGSGQARTAATDQKKTGILLLAHGGSQQWNDNVRALAERLNRDQPVEVAFGMATRANIQTAIDALAARGVTDITAVPLFVSSHSSVVTSTEYLLGLRSEAPPDLALFAKMSHGPAGHAGHEGHAPANAEDGTRPVNKPVPVRMSGALDSHPIVASILADRARAISTDPTREAVIMVAHGPVKEQENEVWLHHMGELATGIRQTAPYASIDYMTVRDDAPPAVKEAATKELRALVEKRRAAGSRVLIVPVLLSFGGIEQGIRKRLEGLQYTMAPAAIMPDDRVADWVKAQLGCGC